MAESRTAVAGATSVTGSTTLAASAAVIGSLFERVVARLGDWRTGILSEGIAETSPARLDERVRALVVPALAADEPLLIGAGFIASPELVRGRDVHFSWWLGPLEANPVFGATTEPAKLDLASRYYTDYLRDFRSLEWYSIPESTHQTHITGPYVDHLCACDYIITITAPVEVDGAMIGVVGADLLVKRLERELLPALLAIDRPVSLVNEAGRVMVSTDPALAAGSILPPDVIESALCPGTPFSLALTSHSR